MLNTSSFRQYCPFCRRLISPELKTSNEICKDCQKSLLDFNPLSNFTKALQKMSKETCHVLLKVIKKIIAQIPDVSRSMMISRSEYNQVQQIIQRYSKHQISSRAVLYEPSIWNFIVVYAEIIFEILEIKQNSMLDHDTFDNFVTLIEQL